MRLTLIRLVGALIFGSVSMLSAQGTESTQPDTVIRDTVRATLVSELGKSGIEATEAGVDSAVSVIHRDIAAAAQAGQPVTAAITNEAVFVAELKREARTDARVKGNPQPVVDEETVGDVLERRCPYPGPRRCRPRP